MQNSSFRRTLLLGLGFLTPSSRTMATSLIVKHSGAPAVKWALEIDIQLQLICRETGKLKQSIKL